jgi:hypothetical protein
MKSPPSTTVAIILTLPQVTTLTNNDGEDLCREKCCQLHLVRGRPISASFPEEPTALGRRMRSWLETSGPARFGCGMPTLAAIPRLYPNA